MKYFFILFAFFSYTQASAHHYKGLPHYSYFENYPQVPILEFISESPDYELFVTIYNFQGLNLNLVNSPDDIRFYIYLYDIQKNSSYQGTIDFEISSHGKPILKAPAASPEQENIYILQNKIKEQDDLILSASFLDDTGKNVVIRLPIQITESFLEKYGLYLAIFLFFALVMLIKMLLVAKGKRSNMPLKEARV